MQHLKTFEMFSTPVEEGRYDEGARELPVGSDTWGIINDIRKNFNDKPSELKSKLGEQLKKLMPEEVKQLRVSLSNAGIDSNTYILKIYKMVWEKTDELSAAGAFSGTNKSKSEDLQHKIATVLHGIAEVNTKCWFDIVGATLIGLPKATSRFKIMLMMSAVAPVDQMQLDSTISWIGTLILFGLAKLLGKDIEMSSFD